MINLSTKDKMEIAELTAKLVFEKLQGAKPASDWMTVRDAAKYLGRSESFIRANKSQFMTKKQGDKNQSRLLLSRKSLDIYINNV